MEIYLLFSLMLIGFIGVRLFKLGSAWSTEFIKDIKLSSNVNIVLLVLFYLFNGGLILVSVYFWEDASNQLIYALSRVGLALFLVGFLHILNIIWILYFFHFKT
jgi:hypothetical protein